MDQPQVQESYLRIVLAGRLLTVHLRTFKLTSGVCLRSLQKQILSGDSKIISRQVCFLLIRTNELLKATDDCRSWLRKGLNARGNFYHWHAGSLSMTATRQRLFSFSTMVNSVATLAVRYRISWIAVEEKHPIAQDKGETKEILNQSVLPFLS